LIKNSGSRLQSTTFFHKDVFSTPTPVLPGPEIVFRLEHKKSSDNSGKRQISQKRHCNIQHEGSIRNKVHVFLCLWKYVRTVKIRNFCRKYSLAPFLLLLVKFDQKFFRPAFVPGPFWAFWPKFRPPGNTGQP
jgi:hypothetical protein